MTVETSTETAARVTISPGAASSGPDPLAARYERDGYLAPLRVLEPEEADGCWRRMQTLRKERPEDAQTAFSFNPHYLLPWLYDLARHPRILDQVERVLGPDILVWSSGFFSKMPHDPAYVSWHQDSTYWGLEPVDIVSAWVAFTRAGGPTAACGWCRGPTPSARSNTSTASPTRTC